MRAMTRYKTQKIFALLVICSTTLIGCGSSLSFKDSNGQDMLGKTAYTQHVLRPDRTRGRLYTLNYQLPDAIMPLCTEVELKEISPKVLIFTETKTGRDFHYFYHKSSGIPIEKAAAETFGLSCNSAEAKQLSAKDQEGIKSGKILRGMTKKGVLLAAGKPPAHRTPYIEDNIWTYWKNRFNTMQVHFNAQGRVEKIVD